MDRPSGTRTEYRAAGHVVAALAAAAVLVLGASACDSGSANSPDDVDTSVVDGAGVPFDADVTPGIDTPTDEVGNQGLDPATPGPAGNASPSPSD